MSGTTRQFVFALILSCNMGHNGFGRGFLDSDENPTEMDKGFLVHRIFDILPDMCRTSRREGTEDQRNADSRAPQSQLG
jgi:hypothetical protein